MARSGRASRTAAAKGEGTHATRRALVDAAIESLRFDGFRRCERPFDRSPGRRQSGLGLLPLRSVAELLLAALAEVSERRMARYSAAVSGAHTPADLVAVATDIFREDLDEGYVTVLVEISRVRGASPELGEQVAALIAPWRTFAQQAIETIVASSPFRRRWGPSETPPHAVVALYLGLEMLSHLDGDRAPALRLFEQAELARRRLQRGRRAARELPRKGHTMTTTAAHTDSHLARIDTLGRRGDGRVQLQRTRDRAPAARTRPRGSVRSRGTPNTPILATPIDVPPPSLDFADLPALARGSRRRHDALQHVLDPVRTRRDEPRAGDRELKDALPRRAPGRRATHRAREHHPPGDRVALSVLPRQGARRARHSPKPGCRTRSCGRDSVRWTTVCS